MDIKYLYNELGLLTQVREQGRTVNYQYDHANRPVAMINGVTGVETRYRYNSGNMLVSLVNQNESDIFSSYEYEYDRRGNQIKKVDSQGTTRYYYDTLSRLKAASLPDNKIQDYTYDNLGNLTGLVEIGNDGIKDTTYQYDRNSRLLLQEEAKGDEVTKNLVDYDANGNQLEKNKLFYSEGKLIFSENATFRFDGLNQLREAITTEGIRVNYNYNGNGLRATKDVDGEITNFTYDLGNIILETYENGMPKARNFFGHSLISRQTADDVYYYLFNGHGDVVQLTDELGDILKDYRYDPFGKEMDDHLSLIPGKPSASLWRNEIEKLDNPFQYAGEYRDQETGLYYLRARYYDPQIQRFISEDSFAKHPYWQQHVYAYCGYNPVNNIDPSGYAYVWNRFGEVIGTTEGSSFTDYSQKATVTHGGTAEIVNRPWDGDSDAPVIGKKINDSISEYANKIISDSSGNTEKQDLGTLVERISYAFQKGEIKRDLLGENGLLEKDIVNTILFKSRGIMVAGYFDFNLSGSYNGIGILTGIIYDAKKDKFYLYIGGGAITPPGGVVFTHSPNETSPGWYWGMQIATPVVYQGGSSLDLKKYYETSYDEWGIGTHGGSISGYRIVEAPYLADLYLRHVFNPILPRVRGLDNRLTEFGI